MIRLLMAAAFLLGSGAALAENVRTEVPITQTRGSNGRYYYFVTLSVGGSAPFQALLDSGSAGLRLLPGPVDPKAVEATGHESKYDFATGSEFTGTIGRAMVAIGGAATDTPARVQMISGIGCRSGQPNCPAAGMSIDAFGFASEGLTGPPQRARLGIGLNRAEDADNPLALIGKGQWIVELPRAGDSAPGRLILNPTTADMAGFTRLRLDRDNTVAGCVVNKDSGVQVCGHVLLDTGGYGMLLEARERPKSFPWAEGAHAELVLAGMEGKVAMPFQVQHVPGTPTALHWGQSNMPEPRISGVFVFMANAVLFDARAHVVGFRPR